MSSCIRILIAPDACFLKHSDMSRDRCMLVGSLGMRMSTIRMALESRSQ